MKQLVLSDKELEMLRTIVEFVDGDENVAEHLNCSVEEWEALRDKVKQGLDSGSV